jgi:PAS domain S-box-containing protein
LPQIDFAPQSAGGWAYYSTDGHRGGKASITMPSGSWQANIEQSLKQSEARFRLVVEAAPNAMVMTDASGRIEMVNTQAERVFGYPRAELLGQPVEMLVPLRFRDHHPAQRGAFFKDPQSRPMGAGRDLYGLRKDGEFPVEIGLNPMETEDGNMVLSAITDISERKHREDIIQLALREKDLLLSEVHHRVKNNLQVVHSLLNLQSGKITDPQALELITESQNRIKTMSLIHQTLYESKDFAKVDFGKFLDSLVPNLVSSYATRPGRVAVLINASNIMLPIDVAIPCGLIVNELISNALKHAFPGDSYGQVAIDLVSDIDHHIRLSVSDDGVGIAETQNLTDGATLGLELVTLLADQLAAEVAIQRSKPTRFSLTLKVQQ